MLNLTKQTQAAMAHRTNFCVCLRLLENVWLVCQGLEVNSSQFQKKNPLLFFLSIET